MTRSKEGNDADDVVTELVPEVGLVTGMAVVHCCAVNHEPHASLGQDPGHEFASKTAEAVLVGNDNLADSARVDGVQKGDKAGPEIEAAANVGEELVFGIVAAKEGTLAFKVSALVCAADAGIADTSLGTRFRFRVLGDTEDALDIAEVIETLARATDAEDANLAIVGPGSKCSARDSMS